ncbi:MAG: cation:proton antiporter [Acidobacteriota bacterium]
MELLYDVVILFGLAVFVVAISQRLRVPSLVGFLLTGMVAGPSGLGLTDAHNVELLAELGVVFLLFTIGLEISPQRLRKLGRYLSIGGPLQVGGTTVVVAGIALASGVEPRRALFYGFVAALSSTAVVLKLYQERRELESPHGRVGLGILVFQDFLIVPLLLVVPILAGTSGASAGEVAARFGGGIVVVAVVFFLGRYPLRWALDFIVATRIRELFVLGALFASLGGALATEHLGFSLALGGFLAGLLIAETEYHHQVLAETAPFRDAFNSLFFISIGMLLDLGFVAEHLGSVVGLSVGLFLLKAVVIYLAVAALGLPNRVRIIAALGLAQIGEFSLVLARAGFQAELLDPDNYQRVLAAAIFTLLATPAAIALAPRLAALMPGRSTPQEESGPPPQVVVVGAGLHGRHLARVLTEGRIPYRILEIDRFRARAARERKQPVLFGDATRRDILEAAGLEQAVLLVLGVSDLDAQRRILSLARRINPRIHIIVRTRALDEIEELDRLGADEVIAEEFETSIEVVTRVLFRLHLPRNVINTQARLLRQDGYQMLRVTGPTGGLSKDMIQALASSTTETFLLPNDHPAAGRSLRDIDLRARTGATILAVTRETQPHSNPSPTFVLEAGDLLVIHGSHAELEEVGVWIEVESPESEEAEGSELSSGAP